MISVNFVEKCRHKDKLLLSLYFTIENSVPALIYTELKQNVSQGPLLLTYSPGKSLVSEANTLNNISCKYFQ